MNPTTGDIFLDQHFPTRSNQTKPTYILVVGDTPHVEGSVLIAALNPAKRTTHFAGPEWDWPERFIIPARLTSLNIPAEVLIDDVYRANQARLLQSCSFAGQVDPDIMGEILWALCQSPGVPGIYCMALEQIALQLAPQGGQP